MALDRAEIKDVAEAIALEIVRAQHRYALTFRQPKTVAEGIRESMGEELTAANWYRERAQNSIAKGDPVTADLYEHIAGEEDAHYRDFNDRLGEIGEYGGPIPA